MDLKTAKNIGGIGAILTILSVVPTVGWVVSLIGFILVLIAIKTIADAVGKNKIFTDYIIAAVLNIVSSIMLAVGGIAAFLRLFRQGFGGFAAIGIAVLIIGWILSVVGGYFVKSSFDGINQATGEKNFKTAGLFIFIGSILQIIVVGFIVSFIGIIFEVIGFFSLPDALVKPTPEPEQAIPQEIPPQPPQSV